MYKDKEKQKEHARKHYQLNKDKVKQRSVAFTKIASKRNRDYINSFLAAHPCIDCGEADPIVLEFDHVRGVKKADISYMVLRGYALKSIEDEIGKCEVRCANCHRRVTVQRRILLN